MVKLARAARVRGTAKALLLDLAVYADANGVVERPFQDLAEDLCVDASNLHRALVQIEELGLVEKVGTWQGRGKKTAYLKFKNHCGSAMIKSNKDCDSAMITDEKDCDSAPKTLRIRRENIAESQSPYIIGQEMKQGEARRAHAREEQPIRSGEREQHPIWGEALARLQHLIVSEKFDTYIATARCDGIDRRGIRLSAPTPHHKSNIYDYESQICQVGAEVLGVDGDFDLVVTVDESMCA